MKRSTSRLLWALALLLLVGVLVFVNLPVDKPAPRPAEQETTAPEGESPVPEGESPVPSGAQPGERLPDFRVTCLDGSEFSLSAQRGKVVVINLWATWCTPCVKELPHFDRLLQEHPEEVAVIALHSPPVTTDVNKWLADFSYALPFAVDEDGSLSALLGASTVLPQTLILDREGLVVYNQPGSLS